MADVSLQFKLANSVLLCQSCAKGNFSKPLPRLRRALFKFVCILCLPDKSESPTQASATSPPNFETLRKIGMKRLLCAIIYFAAVASHASDADYSYNPSEISVSLPGNNNGQSQIKIYGGWFDVPMGVGAKIMGGNSPISVCNDALYYLKIGDREKLSSFYPPKDRQKVLSSRIKFMDRQIKGYVSSGEYCFIIFANGSFMPLKLISGKWTIYDSRISQAFRAFVHARFC